jgi:hypothetical protein
VPPAAYGVTAAYPTPTSPAWKPALAIARATGLAEGDGDSDGAGVGVAEDCFGITAQPETSSTSAAISAAHLQMLP